MIESPASEPMDNETVLLAMRERRYSDALRMLERAADAGAPEVSLWRAQSLWGVGRYDEALGAFRFGIL